MLNGGYYIKKRILRATSAAIAAVMLITGVPVPGPGIKPDIVMAAETGEGISSYTLNGSTFKGTLEDAFYKIYKGQDNFLSLNSDFTVASALTLPKDTKLEIKMNGHQISGSSTQLICVSSGAALRIIGNNGVIRSFGSTGKNGGTIYAGDNELGFQVRKKIYKKIRMRYLLTVTGFRREVPTLRNQTLQDRITGKDTSVSII